jgi:peptide/nickel transport system substrate-binding protein
MKRFVWRSLAVSSALLAVMAAAQAETRPQYGGTLHVAMRAAPASLDPADAGPDSFARRNVSMLMFETLITTDDNGRIRPLLATSWHGSADNRHWQFRLRRGARFHDGTPLTADAAAASLRAANPSWNVSADGDSVVIERDGSDPEILSELALPRNAIAKRNAGSVPSGTGPFHVVDWQQGKKLRLAAEEGHWRGRPFLDGIEIEMGRSYRDQVMALEAGKADLVEVAAEQAHRVALEGRRLASSAPVELLALVFARDVSSPDDKHLREALALSVERGSMRSVLLQSAGQPAGGILPDWISGYGFVFPTEADLPRARHEREQVRSVPQWTLGYDGNDPLARLLAERIALIARDAGLTLQPTSGTAADVQLVRIPLAAVDPWIALADAATLAGLPATRNIGASVEDLYAAEQAALASQRMIPLFHLPVYWAGAATLKDWMVRPDGRWDLADAWLGNGKP